MKWEYRAYYKLEMTLLSPLSIGASDSTFTDKDVVLDSQGEPVIPATAIAGAYRALAADKSIFGDLNGNDTELLFYDAELVSDDFIAIRDCVKLNDEKTAKKGAKFDFQAVETGAVFRGYVEARSDNAAAEFEKLLTKKLSLGSKSTRGYGLLEIRCGKKIFIADMLDEWLEFDMFSCDKWDSLEIKDGVCGGEKTIKLSLKQNGGLSIRRYYTEPDKPDTGPLCLHDNDKTPVIPGTSWAGMFRSHMKKLLDGDNLNVLFGFVDGNGSSKSKIRFGESILSGAAEKRLTRNAIDRFTNGTKDGALFTEITVYNGETELEISLDKEIIGKTTDAMNALLVTILDLHNGYAAVGGLTSIGRGLFKINSINGEPFSENWDVENLREVVFGGR
jgi:CRISPR/Cas system CSM-associated protein Csm3 (group 7 of RAMP superfamily)